LCKGLYSDRHAANPLALTHIGDRAGRAERRAAGAEHPNISPQPPSRH
jgi:hypothetical protein